MTPQKPETIQSLIDARKAKIDDVKSKMERQAKIIENTKKKREQLKENYKNKLARQKEIIENTEQRRQHYEELVARWESSNKADLETLNALENSGEESA